MKKLKFNKIKQVLTVFLLGFICVNADAQKLPEIQENSVRAPANIKIDGKLTEWNNKLQARNHLSRIWYTVSNDDNNLYLAVLDYDNDKILHGGLTFTISNSTDKKLRKKATDNISISFPVRVSKNISHISIDVETGQGLIKDSISNRKQIDSLTTDINRMVESSFKEILVIGIKEIKDSLISVYNGEGIKAAVQFDKKMAYIYELAIPLKYLGLTINNQAQFSYNILLPGPPPIPIPVEKKIGINEDELKTPGEYYYYSGPIDFWGEYTLAKNNHF